MTFISLHAKLQLSSILIVDVTADSGIRRVGLMLPPYEVWCSAPEDHIGHCVWTNESTGDQSTGAFTRAAVKVKRAPLQ